MSNIKLNRFFVVMITLCFSMIASAADIATEGVDADRTNVPEFEYKTTNQNEYEKTGDKRGSDNVDPEIARIREIIKQLPVPD